MKIQKISAAALLLATLSACCSTMDVTDTNKAETFTARVASSDRLEIETSQLALSKSTNPAVKQIAQQMINDHMQSSQNLKTILAAHDETPPPSPPPLSPYHEHMLQSLQNSQNLDCDYLNGQQVAHEQAISMFDAYITYGDMPALQQFAAQTLPVLHQHLHMVQDAELQTHCVMTR